MLRFTFVIATLLELLGIFGFVLTGSQHYTALIPVGFGVLLMICFGLARARPSMRMHAMHAAMTVALIGMLGTLSGIYHVGQMLAGQTIARPPAAEAQAIMCILCAVYLAVGIRSFIKARRARA
jgi:hypothetical protein